MPGRALTLIVTGAAAVLVGLPLTLLLAATVLHDRTDTPAATAGGPLRAAAVPAPYQDWIIAAGAGDDHCPPLSPALLAAQLAQESGFNPRAISAVGAQGIAQFMPGTWPTWAVDADGNGTASPFDPADAITAQGRFMCVLLADTADGIADGSLTGDPVSLALAAYNCGLSCVRAAGGLPATPQTSSNVSASLERSTRTGAAAAGSGGAYGFATSGPSPSAATSAGSSTSRNARRAVASRVAAWSDCAAWPI
ncbi:lytic transglycosylase domain-containing protein [Frankia sp. Cj3]|uniref:lytic transglycosylase domain-containing protein n=1 Tax=Frankia sp. Cj3 TaxID=2880976 RepID=UPI001EF47096|nr:lytic transglycosylase domain-containing protein [Frankia sp. Cj3]